MKFGKQKRHRRIVRFYTACFGFRQPFKVLCDGTFIYHIIANGIRVAPPNDAVSSLLGARTKLFTTTCVLKELKSFGESYFEALKFGHSLATARCDHEKRKSAVACIKEVIGENNSEHFFVATIDAKLRNELQQLPGVPVAFGLRNALFLAPPSEFQRDYVRTAEQKRLHMTEQEYKMLSRRAKSKFATEEIKASTDASEDSHDEMMGSNPTRKRMSAKDRAQFKKKRAKGPNPLSCLKKKSQRQPQPKVDSKKEDNDGNKPVKNRSRKRKRTRGGKKVEETES